MTPPPPAPPPPSADRIPEDQPFVVRPRKLKLAVAPVLVTVPVLGCIGGALATTAADERGRFLVMSLFWLAVAAALWLNWWLLATGGPTLALSPAGVWVRQRRSRGRALFLPWELVGRVYPRRWGLEKAICIQPRDPRTGSGPGLATKSEQGMSTLFFGSGFIASITYGDRSEAEIVQAAAQHTAGRSYVG